MKVLSATIAAAALAATTAITVLPTPASAIGVFVGPRGGVGVRLGGPRFGYGPRRFGPRYGYGYRGGWRGGWRGGRRW